MAILKIRRMGDPVLAQPAQPVSDPAHPSVRVLVADMIETMIDASGAGLAAPQIGVPLRVVIFQAPAARSAVLEGEEAFDHTAPLTALVNPVVTILEGPQELGWEGCLSVPGLRGKVPRATHIRYSGVTPEGERITREARGFHARVVQHECDHLDGVLYPQRMIDMRDLIFESEWRHRLAAMQETSDG